MDGQLLQAMDLDFAARVTYSCSGVDNPGLKAREFAVFFIFFIFYFHFLQKIYFRFRNLQEYTPAAQLAGGRHLVAPLPGGKGLSVKIFVKKLCSGP